MAILSKACKPDNFESHDSLKLSFTNIWDLRSNFVDCELFLESFKHSCSVWDKPGWLNWFSQFLCERLSSFNLKGFYCSYTWSRSSCERRTFFCTGPIPRKLCRFLLMFFRLVLLHSVSDFFFLYRSHPSAISSNIDEVLLINPSANVFLSLETLMSIIRTGSPILVELINLL